MLWQNMEQNLPSSFFFWGGRRRKHFWGMRGDLRSTTWRVVPFFFAQKKSNQVFLVLSNKSKFTSWDGDISIIRASINVHYDHWLVCIILHVMCVCWSCLKFVVETGGSIWCYLWWCWECWALPFGQLILRPFQRRITSVVRCRLGAWRMLFHRFFWFVLAEVGSQHKGSFIEQTAKQKPAI